MTHTPEEIMTKLGELDADEIARLFRDEGIVGIPGNSFACPVTNYVRRETDVAISTNLTGWYALKGGFDRDIPQTVLRFVLNFDDDRYPDLVEDD